MSSSTSSSRARAELFSKYVFSIGEKHTTPIVQEVLASGGDTLLEEMHKELSKYDISRIRGDKTKDAYGKNVLLRLGKIFNIPKSLNKNELALEILRRWEEQFPEDFKK